MGHHVTGLIARCETFAELGGSLSMQPHFALNDGFGFLPLDYANLDDVAGLDASEAVENFAYLTPKLIEVLRVASKFGDLAYVETEYFGGAGGQGAAVFRAGEIALRPTYAESGAINQALALLGVSVPSGTHDAFDAIGLDQRRHNEDFREAPASA